MLGIAIATMYVKESSTKVRDRNLEVLWAKIGLFGKSSSSMLALKEKFIIGNTNKR